MESKLKGIYYTPRRVSDYIINLFQNDKSIKSILEPSFGNGVFIDSFIDSKLISNGSILTAIEINKSEYLKIKKHRNICLLNIDFFKHNNKEYDLIVGNPPYIRYHYLDNDTKDILSNILRKQNMKPNRATNIWVGFLISCIHFLKSGSSLALVLPTDILQLLYAAELRLFLSKELSNITIITFKDLMFSNIQQDTIIFIGKKGMQGSSIRVINLRDINDLSKLDLDRHSFQPLSRTRDKWTKYLLSSKENTLIENIRNDNRFCKFSKQVVTSTGVLTGNNDYFTIKKDTELKYNLTNILTPLLGRSSQMNGVYFTKDDLLSNIENGNMAQLLTLQQYPSNKLHREYINLGIRNNINNIYKCRIRKEWYIIPSIWISDAFFLKRSHFYPKLTINKCKAISTNSIHRLQFNKNINHNNILLSYYNSIAFAFTELEGNSYGGGALDLLPSDINNIMIPIITNIDIQTELIYKIDNIIRNKGDIEEVLNIVDQEVLVNILKIDSEICKCFRLIWKKLQTRRLKI